MSKKSSTILVRCKEDCLIKEKHMLKRWELYKTDDNMANTIARENHISPLLSKIILNRGIKEVDEIKKFLDPQIADLNDPFLLNDMDKAVCRILEAKENNEKVTVYGDYDVDGITSVSVIYRFLQELGMDVGYYLPSRLEEGYGLNNEAIQTICANGTKLLITVDCGISAYEEVEYAKSLGIDVIVTDHHECPEKLPEAIAVIDAKRPDNTYPFTALAGVGVAFKVTQAISQKLALDRKSYLKYLDIVCLGTVADIVPLVKENRVIVKYGLMLMKETKNIGLKALITVSGYTKIDSTMISFGLAPRINACGRMGKADLALELILTQDEAKAEEIANQLNIINKERQEAEKSIVEEAKRLIEENRLYENDVIVVASEGWHHGVIGIVASKITEMYYKPSILICMEDGVGRGSGRSIEGFDLHAALSACSEDLLKYGGHEMAIGLTIKEDMLAKFQEDMGEYAKGKFEKGKVPTIMVDAEIRSNMISMDLIKELSILEPFGEANPVPIFVYKNMKVDGVRLLSNDRHLKLLLKDNTSVYDAIAFNMGDMQYSIKVGDKLDVLHYLDINRYNNVEKIQLNVKDIKKSL